MAMVASVRKRTRVSRMVNPKRKRKRNVARHLSAKQIRYFGTPQQKAALKRKRRQAVAPHRKRNVAQKHAKRRVRRATNPALVLTLGAVNPRRKTKMAATKKRRRKASSSRRRKSNPRRVQAMAPVRHRRRNTRRRNPVVRSRRRRNPNLFGQKVAGVQMGKAVAGGLVGVAAAKFIPTMLPAGLVGSNIMRVIATGVSAFVAGWLAGKADRTFGDAVLFGGLMQTGSVALNAFVPSIGKQIGLSGLTPARFPLPDNPIAAGMAMMNPAAAAGAPIRAANVAGLAAFGSAW
jgi:hypothetical protein